jgi:hypothetical protein
MAKCNGIVGEGETVFIIKGHTSGDQEVWPGTPEGTVEWQFSDGPSGSRGGSYDYLDLTKGLMAHKDCRFNIDEARFTEAEHHTFVMFCLHN